MRVQTLILSLLTFLIILGCGPTYDEVKLKDKLEREKRQKQDSLALKIGVTPTLDCFPIYLAKEHNMFDTLRADIRLKTFTGGIDSDDALLRGKLEAEVTDIVRGEYLKNKGANVEYVASLNTSWQLISNKKARIKQIKQLSDKMVAMARFSASAFFVDYAVDSVKLKAENVFKIQINDLDLRVGMLLNNEMDAALLPEPQASIARAYGNPVLMDSRDKGINLGVIAFRSDLYEDNRRKEQIEVFLQGYNMACDSINSNGINYYTDILEKYYKNIDEKTLKLLPKLKFEHANSPKEKDINLADNWLKKQK